MRRAGRRGDRGAHRRQRRRAGARPRPCRRGCLRAHRRLGRRGIRHELRHLRADAVGDLPPGDRDEPDGAGARRPRGAPAVPPPGPGRAHHGGLLFSEVGSPYISPYVTSKFGLLGLAEVLRQELRRSPPHPRHRGAAGVDRHADLPARRELHRAATCIRCRRSPPRSGSRRRSCARSGGGGRSSWSAGPSASPTMLHGVAPRVLRPRERARPGAPRAAGRGAPAVGGDGVRARRGRRRRHRRLALDAVAGARRRSGGAGAGVL